MKAFVTMSGYLRRLRRDVLLRGLPVRLSETRDRNPCVAVSMAMRLCAAMRAVSAVSVWATVDETSMERSVGVENCDWGAWRELENETPRRPASAKTHGGTALNPFDSREMRVGWVSAAKALGRLAVEDGRVCPLQEEVVADGDLLLPVKEVAQLVQNDRRVLFLDSDNSFAS